MQAVISWTPSFKTTNPNMRHSHSQQSLCLDQSSSVLITASRLMSRRMGMILYYLAASVIAAKVEGGHTSLPEGGVIENPSSSTTSLSSDRALQDETICQELLDEIVEGTTTADIKDSCQCSGTNDGGTRLTCRRDNLCLASSSDDGESMRGDFQTIYTVSGSGQSYNRETEIETCFTYPSDVNSGETVCVSSTEDGLGTVATCQITVGGKACNVCRYCPIDLISFDCSNLGYEERTACADDNAKDSIVQFLYEPQLGTGCPSSSGGSSSSSSSTTSMAPHLTPWTIPKQLGLMLGLLSILVMF